MREAEALAGSGPVRPQEPLADELVEARLQVLALVQLRELEHRLEREAPADDGGALQRRALRAVEPVEALVENAPDRARHRGRAALVGDRRELLHEQRIALGRLGDPLADCRGRSERLEEHLRVGVRERIEHPRLRRRLQPGRSPLCELGSCEAEQEDAGVAEPRAQVLDEVEECGLGPVDVLEHGHDRPLGGQLLEHLPRGSEDLVARTGRQSLVTTGLPAAARGAARR